MEKKDQNIVVTNCSKTASFKIAERLAARLAVKKRLHAVAIAQGKDEVIMPCEAFWNASDEAALAAFELHMNQLLGIDNDRRN
jgi:hypothetical protein